MTSRLPKWRGGVAAVGAAVLLVCWSGEAGAEGAPAAAAIAYSGALLKGGEPVRDRVSIGAVLWPVAIGGTSGDSTCTIPSAFFEPLPGGRFRLPLDACAWMLHKYPDVWLELQVNGEALAPRVKVGAVPYALEATNAAKVTHGAGERKMTLQGEYCSPTSSRVDGNLDQPPGANGFVAAKALCEQSCSSPTAHVCLAEEVVRLLQLGVAPPINGWIATGTATMGSAGQQCTANDCRGFTYDGATDSCGSVWAGTTVQTIRCDWKMPILCCD